MRKIFEPFWVMQELKPAVVVHISSLYTLRKVMHSGVTHAQLMCASPARNDLVNKVEFLPMQNVVRTNKIARSLIIT